MPSSFIVIGIGGSVLALDRATGQEIWRTKLKGDFVYVAFVDSDLFATAYGELYCLDPATGKVRWKNQLKGLGMNLISIAAPGAPSVLFAKKKQDDDAASAAMVT